MCEIRYLKYFTETTSSIKRKFLAKVERVGDDLEDYPFRERRRSATMDHETIKRSETFHLLFEY